MNADDNVVGILRAAARGSYQRAIIEGRARWSGSDLRGRAGEFGGKYARSRRALLARILAAMPGCRAIKYQEGRFLRCGIIRDDGRVVAVIG